MADSLEAVSFDDEEVVVKQGEAGNDFFIIVEGTAIVSFIFYFHTKVFIFYEEKIQIGENSLYLLY